MYRTILLPLDGSALAERAVPYARFLAQASGARLLLLQATQAAPCPDPDPARDQVRAARAARAYLAGVAAQFGQRAIVETVVFDAPATEAILAETRVRTVDLIVLATHGRSEPERPLDGSVADQVVQRAEGPILLIPAVTEHPWSRDRPLRMVVPLPLDARGGDDDVLTCLDALAGVLGAALLLPCVVAPLDAADVRVSSPPVPVAAQPATPPDVEAIAAGQRRGGERAIAVHVAAGDAVTTIVTIAREQAADVIVLSTAGYGGLPHLAIGGLGAELLRRACLPLLLVRPDAGQQAARPPGALSRT